MAPCTLVLVVLHRIMLVVDETCRACEIIDLIDLHIKRNCDIMPNDLEMRVTDQVGYISFASCEEVVDTNYFIIFMLKPFAFQRNFASK
jgi:hypothetical protein